MKKWKINFSKEAKDNLHEIRNYVAVDLKNPIGAKNLIRRIREEILNLNQMPERFPVYDREPWKSRGLRWMAVDNYTAFYITDKSFQTVTIFSVVYSKRDMANVLSEKYFEIAVPYNIFFSH